MKTNKYLQEKKSKKFRYSREAEKFRPSTKRIVKKHLDDVKEDLKIHNYNVTLRKLCMIMSSIYMKDKIRFIDDGDVYEPSFDYAVGSDFYKNGDIEIFLSNKAPERIKKLSEENRFKDLTDVFYKEIMYLISHTKVYVKRIKALKDEFNFIGYAPIKKHIIDYMRKYAYESAVELEEEGFSPTRSLVYDLIGQLPEYKKFKSLMEEYREHS